MGPLIPVSPVLLRPACGCWNSMTIPAMCGRLENIIERAMILETGTELTPESLLIGCQNEPAGVDEGESLRIDEAEQEHILRVLKSAMAVNWRQPACWGLNKTTLWRKMKRYGIGEE